MHRSKVSKIAKELRIILEHGIDREWGFDSYTSAAIHVCNLNNIFTTDIRGSEILISYKDNVIATCIWCDLGISFDNYHHNHPLLYEFLKITLNTVKELRSNYPLQEH